MEQIQPLTSFVTTISLPDGFSGTPTKLLITLADQLPVTGPPAAVLATINNADADGDGTGDVEQILNPDRDLVLALPDVGVIGTYHVVVALYMEGGGQFEPVPGVDYMAASGPMSLGAGQVAVELELMLVP